MADPIDFMGSNAVFTSADPNVRDLPLLQGNGQFISCWKLTPEELEQVRKTGEVWLNVVGVMGENGYLTTPPVFVSGSALMKAVSVLTGDEVKYYTSGVHVVDDAMTFAQFHHADQLYNRYDQDKGAEDGMNRDFPYTYHLQRVVNLLAELGFDWRYQAAGWLHDVIEDQLKDMILVDRIEYIQTLFGEFIARLVWCCTGQDEINGVKTNRKQRGEEQYAKIAKFPEAAIVKMADRIENMQACIDFNNKSKGGMYLKEADLFFEKVGVLAPENLQQRYHETVQNLVATFRTESK